MRIAVPARLALAAPHGAGVRSHHCRLEAAAYQKTVAPFQYAPLFLAPDPQQLGGTAFGPHAPREPARS
jgi:hypothetical protein